MPWWSIFTTWSFWLGYIIGFSLATAIAGILNKRNNPYIGTVLYAYGDVDQIAEKVEKALSELTNWVDKHVGKEPLGNQLVNKYVFTPVLRYVNKVYVFPSDKYFEKKEVEIIITGLERGKIKKRLKEIV